MLRGEKKRKPVDPYKRPTRLRKLRDREREEETRLLEGRGARLVVAIDDYSIRPSREDTGGFWDS